MGVLFLYDCHNARDYIQMCVTLLKRVGNQSMSAYTPYADPVDQHTIVGSVNFAFSLLALPFYLLGMSL